MFAKLNMRIHSCPRHLFVIPRISLTTHFAHRRTLVIAHDQGLLDSSKAELNPEYMTPLHGLYCTERR